MSYTRYLWSSTDPRHTSLIPRLPTWVFCTGRTTRVEILENVYIPAHRSQTVQIPQNTISSTKIALSILNPKPLINSLFDDYESIFTYERRIAGYLNLEKFMKDPITMEESEMCELISTYKITINEDGDIDLDDLGVYLDMNVVPRTMRRRITEFCDFLVKSFVFFTNF